MAVLVTQLPLESQTARHKGAPRPGGWTQETELLAGVVDLLIIGNYLFTKAHTKKGTTVPKPERVRRPDAARQVHKRRPFTAEELAAKLGRSRGVVRYHPKTEPVTNGS